MGKYNLAKEGGGLPVGNKRPPQEEELFDLWADRGIGECELTRWVGMREGVPEASILGGLGEQSPTFLKVGG